MGLFDGINRMNGGNNDKLQALKAKYSTDEGKQLADEFKNAITGGPMRQGSIDNSGVSLFSRRQNP